MYIFYSWATKKEQKLILMEVNTSIYHTLLTHTFNKCKLSSYYIPGPCAQCWEVRGDRWPLGVTTSWVTQMGERKLLVMPGEVLGKLVSRKLSCDLAEIWKMDSGSQAKGRPSWPCALASLGGHRWSRAFLIVNMYLGDNRVMAVDIHLLRQGQEGSFG